MQSIFNTSEDTSQVKVFVTDRRTDVTCSKLMVPSERSLSQAPVFESIFYSRRVEDGLKYRGLQPCGKVGWLVGCGL